MNTLEGFTFDWRKDLERARNLSKSEKTGFELVLSWYENWRLPRSLPPGRDSAAAWAGRAGDDTDSEPETP